MFTNLYHTEIYCSKYNLKINEEILVTVKLTDFNNNPVISEAVTLTVDDGEFFNNSKTYEGSTNSDGEVKVKYTSTEWGFHTFKCNDTTTVINVRGGWKKFPLTVTQNYVNNAFGQYNQDEVLIHFEGNIPKYSNTPITVLKLNNGYDFLMPHSTVCVPSHACKGEVYITNTGEVKCIMDNVATHWQNICYARKKFR